MLLPSNTSVLPARLHYIFRIACAMCYIGHGAFGIITKQVWCNYFAVFGIEESLAYQLMPFVGMADIIFGIILIFYPVRAIAGWLIFWGLFTASLRPLSGEPFAEFLERAGNYGAPTLLLLLSSWRVDKKGWFSRIAIPTQLNDDQWKIVIRGMQFFGFLLLAGHGWLNLIEKQALLNQYASLGVGNPSLAARAVGIFEVGAALLILIKPVRPLILVFVLWKVTSELFYPSWEIFEWIERGGSYATLLGLWVVLGEKSGISKMAGGGRQTPSWT